MLAKPAPRSFAGNPATTLARPLHLPGKARPACVRAVSRSFLEGAAWVKNTLNILDLDHSLTAQEPIIRRLNSGQARRLDLLDLGPKLRLWSTERTYRHFTERLRQRPRHSGPQPEIFFVAPVTITT